MTSATSNVLSGPSHGTALFVEADRKTIRVRRRIKHHCTEAEWYDPIHRQARIDEAWRLTADTIRAEGETFLFPSPVTLYRDPLTGRVLFADIQLPHQGGPRWIDTQGRPLLVAPFTAGLVRESTTYAVWAEGPLPYFGAHEALAPPDPLQDRHLQRIRHQNRHLRSRIDPAIAPSFDPIALDAGHDEYIDFRIRGIFERDDLRTINSMQTGEAAKLVVAGETITIRDLDPVDLVD